MVQLFVFSLLSSVSSPGLHNVCFCFDFEHWDIFFCLKRRQTYEQFWSSPLAYMEELRAPVVSFNPGWDFDKWTAYLCWVLKLRSQNLEDVQQLIWSDKHVHWGKWMFHASKNFGTRSMDWIWVLIFQIVIPTMLFLFDMGGAMLGVEAKCFGPFDQCLFKNNGLKAVAHCFQAFLPLGCCVRERERCSALKYTGKGAECKIRQMCVSNEAPISLKNAHQGEKEMSSSMETEETLMFFSTLAGYTQVSVNGKVQGVFFLPNFTATVKIVFKQKSITVREALWTFSQNSASFLTVHTQR